MNNCSVNFDCIGVGQCPYFKKDKANKHFCKYINMHNIQDQGMCLNKHARMNALQRQIRLEMGKSWPDDMDFLDIKNG